MDRVAKILSNVYEIESSSISENLVIRELEKWDSFNHISMIIELENEFNVSFTPTEVESIQSLQDILSLLNSKTTK